MRRQVNLLMRIATVIFYGIWWLGIFSIKHFLTTNGTGTILLIALIGGLILATILELPKWHGRLRRHK